MSPLGKQNALNSEVLDDLPLQFAVSHVSRHSKQTHYISAADTHLCMESFAMLLAQTSAGSFGLGILLASHTRPALFFGMP